MLRPTDKTTIGRVHGFKHSTVMQILRGKRMGRAA